MTKKALQEKFNKNKNLQERIQILRLASEINADFKNPVISGGFLRDTYLNAEPADCDVRFFGKMKNQPGISECVYEAETKLKTKHFNDWEFENYYVNEISGDIYEDTIGFFSNHSDYLTLLMYDTNKKLDVGSKLTLKYLESRTYDYRYQGMMIWMGFRGRGYYRTMAGHGCRGIYLCHKLNLNPSEEAIRVFNNFDYLFERLNEEEKSALLEYWNKKTKKYKPTIGVTLEKYNIRYLK